MQRWTRLVVAMVGLSLTLGVGLPSTVGQEKKADAKKLVETKSEKAEPASSINFAADLGLQFDSLTSLGRRIDSSRKSGDPVGLASAASELAVAEKVSGKKASLTSDALTKEAVDLAKRANRSAELKAVAILAKEDGLVKQAEAAAKLEAQEMEAFKSGEKSRGIAGYLTVENGTGHVVDIYINGVPIAMVYAFKDYTIPIPVGASLNSNTVLEGRSRFEPNRRWGPRVVFDNVQNYTWRLLP